MGFGECNCDHCEEVMQPYLDRALTPEEHAEAEAHLDRLRVLRKAVPLRGRVACVREDRVPRGDVAGAEGEARRAQASRSLRSSG